MTAATRLTVNPAVIRWARTTAGLDETTAATRLNVRATRIVEWESGESKPTINQLRAMSEAYHRPLAALFMPEPLAQENLPKLPDFRRPGVRGGMDPAPLQKAIMRAHRQRDALSEIFAELGYQQETAVADLALSPADDVETSGGKLRSSLGIDAYSRWAVSRPDEFLRELVRRAEGLGVTVIQVQRVDVNLMRGFSIGDGPFPLVALNGGDWPRGKVYTLLHELAHIAFRTSGLCDLQHQENPDLERQCEEIAAAALMPRAQFLSFIGALQSRQLEPDIARAVGNEFGASGEAAVLRMVGLGRASWDDYWRLKPLFEEAYRKFKTEEKAKGQGKDAPIFYQLKVRDLGRRYIRQVLDAYGEDAISTRDLVKLLEVSYDKIPKLAGTLGDVAI